MAGLTPGGPALPSEEKRWEGRTSSPLNPASVSLSAQSLMVIGQCLSRRILRAERENNASESTL